MAKWEDYLEESHLSKILTIGGLVALAIGTSYAIRGYLDMLRIKRLKQQIKAEKNKKPITEPDTDDNWVLNDE